MTRSSVCYNIYFFEFKSKTAFYSSSKPFTDQSQKYTHLNCIFYVLILCQVGCDFWAYIYCLRVSEWARCKQSMAIYILETTNHQKSYPHYGTISACINKYCPFYFWNVVNVWTFFSCVCQCIMYRVRAHIYPCFDYFLIFPTLMCFLFSFSHGLEGRGQPKRALFDHYLS